MTTITSGGSTITSTLTVSSSIALPLTPLTRYRVPKPLLQHLLLAPLLRPVLVQLAPLPRPLPRLLLAPPRPPSRLLQALPRPPNRLLRVLRRLPLRLPQAPSRPLARVVTLRLPLPLLLMVSSALLALPP